jgi:NADPH:quinone reductase-like Zn-dependent oxidoreductase
MTGLRRPSAKHQVRGQDLAGTVEAVGAGVTQLKAGDRVFGSTDGTLAEYACASEKSLAPMPARLSFEQAAAIPMAGLAALHGLRDAARLVAGQHLLVNGASGGIGTFAIQIAKGVGAEVTAVCSGANVELVRELGADHVIDYTVRPLTEGAERYDVILDNVANHSLGTMRRLLTPTGTLLTNSGEVGPDGGPIVRILKAVGHSLRSSQTVKTFLSTPNRDDLAILASMADAGEITPVIDRVYPLEQAGEAMARVASRRARGKVVVSVAPNADALGALPG